jgi:hypothetical protein
MALAPGEIRGAGAAAFLAAPALALAALWL